MAEAAKKPEKGAAEAPAASIIIKKVQGGHGGVGHHGTHPGQEGAAIGRRSLRFKFIDWYLADTPI